MYTNPWKQTHPKVLRKPQTLPSAYRDTMSPKCRKLADPIISPIFGSCNNVGTMTGQSIILHVNIFIIKSS
jgi:hypothetical protein